MTERLTLSPFSGSKDTGVQEGMVLHCPLDINGCLLPTPFEEDVSREGAFKKRLAFCVLRKQSNTAEVLVTA